MNQYPATPDLTNPFDPQASPLRAEPFPRYAITSSGALTSGTIYLDTLSVAAPLKVTTMFAATRSTAASGLTVARMGIFTISPQYVATLVASTPNDTTLFAAANTVYAKALSATYTLQPNQRYALGVVVVGTTPPSLCSGSSQLNSLSGGTALPGWRIATSITGQTDLVSGTANSDPGTYPYLCAY